MDLAVIPVFSLTEPNYAGLLGLSEWKAYEQARRGVVETIPLLGSRKAVLVAPLLRRLGVEGSGEPHAPTDEQHAAASGHVQ
ncbi:hypothetical protein [Terrabacter tumescens]|uniref:hypothetical protein n=1 Tax=Terrabacter tumescens TaxID=60443 RepID=UPI0004C1DBE4|nr:hypothetical protein [Terrabacter tumescens]